MHSYELEDPAAEQPAHIQRLGLQLLDRGISESREELIHIQARLRAGWVFIGTVDGLWNQRTQEAIRQFKITNRLSNPDLWDPETDEKLKSPGCYTGAPIIHRSMVRTSLSGN